MATKPPYTHHQLNQHFPAGVARTEIEYTTFLEVDVRIRKYLAEETLRLKSESRELVLKTMSAEPSQKRRKLNPADSEVEDRLKTYVADKIPHQKLLNEALLIMDIALRSMIIGKLPEDRNMDSFKTEEELKTYMSSTYEPIKRPIGFGKIEGKPFIYTYLKPDLSEEHAYLYISPKVIRDYIKQESDTAVMFVNKHDDAYFFIKNPETAKKIHNLKDRLFKDLLEYSGLLAMAFYNALEKIENVLASQK